MKNSDLLNNLFKTYRVKLEHIKVKRYQRRGLIGRVIKSNIKEKLVKRFGGYHNTILTRIGNRPSKDILYKTHKWFV